MSVSQRLVRAASTIDVFARQSCRHNGHIAGFAKLRRRMVMHMSDEALSAVRGTTDSEVRAV